MYTGELRVFERTEINPEVVMASAALPLLFRAVDIDGVPYWDGGYSGNPAVIPFLRTTASEDVLIVQINPRERRKVPTNTREIMSRVNEINFNASLLSELRGVAFVNRLIDEGRLARGTREGEFRRLKLHRIVMEDVGDTFGARSTLKALLLALLEPTAALRELEDSGDTTSRLALLEEIKTLPFGLVWDEYLQRHNVPSGESWLKDVKTYEREILSRRH